MSLASSSLEFVVVDPSVVVAIAASEPAKYPRARAEIQKVTSDGCKLYAPQLVVMEALFAICRRLQDGLMTRDEHAKAVTNLTGFLQLLEPSPVSDGDLIIRAEQLRTGYGCSHSADAMYIALAEQLAASGPTEILTFDSGMGRHASAASNVTVRVL